LLKDDKGYHYISVSKEDYPRIKAKKQKDDDSLTYIGPYTSSYCVTQTVDAVNKIFMLPTCNKKFPQDIKKTRPCLNYYINQCIGVCKGKISKQQYNDTVNQALSYIKKGSTNLVTHLVDEMQQASDNLEFERAAKIRDRINAIKKVTDSQKVVDKQDQDVIAFCQNINKTAVVILKFRNGQLTDKDDYVLNQTFDLNETRAEFLNQYYLSVDDVPKLIFIDEDFEESYLLSDYLTQKYGKKINIKIPQIGEQKKLVEMAYKNAAEKLAKLTERTNKEISALDELKKALGLEKTPEYIESFDISNMGDSGIVGGMVVYLNGRPYKKAYKRFKIESTVTRDDYKSMTEVIKRRIAHYLDQEETDEGFKRLPDLILLDGGKGHVSTIKPLLEQLNIPVFGMVKDSKHKTKAISTDGKEISIAANKALFSFVTGIQDEVHRYTINYQKKVHTKTALEVSLTRIDGIGPKRAMNILKAFKTKKELTEATVEDIAKAAKINKSLALAVYNFIKEN
ncbi:MAG: excinuclease ABC subunit UvrC, partial [Oscillospiraceae bacterium]